MTNVTTSEHTCHCVFVPYLCISIQFGVVVVVGRVVEVFKIYPFQTNYIVNLSYFVLAPKKATTAFVFTGYPRRRMSFAKGSRRQSNLLNNNEKQKSIFEGEP
jgi:hypothetical protein